MACSQWSSPRLWGIVASFEIAFLLHVYVPPSHGDGYQGKALLHRPGVHHGFHIEAFLLPVLHDTEHDRRMTHLDPTLRQDGTQACPHTQTCYLLTTCCGHNKSSMKLFLGLPSAPSPTASNHSMLVIQALTVSSSFSSSTHVCLENRYQAWFYWVPWAWHPAQNRHMSESRDGKVARCSHLLSDAGSQTSNAWKRVQPGACTPKGKHPGGPHWTSNHELKTGYVHWY